MVCRIDKVDINWMTLWTLTFQIKFIKNLGGEGFPIKLDTKMEMCQR